MAAKVLPETIEKAVSALIKYKEVQSKSEKPQLLPTEEFLYLVLSLKKIPQKSSTNPHKIPLPHPLLSASAAAAELCLIIDDRPSSNLTSKIAKQKIKNDGVPVSKVIRLSKLKTDYKAFESKRKLCDSYDMFFADKRVVTLLPKLLGKQFFKKRKLPLPVDLTHKGWKEQIERLCSSGFLYFRNGTCCVVKVGRVGMEKDEIYGNVSAAIDGIVEFVPKKWGGVRSLHLKFAESLTLPLYQALPDMKLKIQGIVSNDDGDEKSVEVVKEASGEKLGKKGRIHEVKYMDATSNVGVTEVIDGGELGSEGESDDDVVRNELVSKKRKSGAANVEAGSAGKKKKKGDLVKGDVDSKKKSEKETKRKAESGDVKEKSEKKAKGKAEKIIDKEKSEKQDKGEAEKENDKGKSEKLVKSKAGKGDDKEKSKTVTKGKSEKGDDKKSEKQAKGKAEKDDKKSDKQVKGKDEKGDDKKSEKQGKRKAEKGEGAKGKIELHSGKKGKILDSGKKGKKDDNETAIKVRRSTRRSAV